MLPKDPHILLSFVNARLRDQYADEDAIRETLAGLDYHYDPAYHQFR